MKKVLLSTLICIISCVVFAQSSWSSAGGTNVSWSYVMDGSKSNQTVGTAFPSPSYSPNYSTSTSTTPGFMPPPPSGYSRAYAPNNGGTYQLVESGADDKLKMNVSTQYASKFAVLGIPEATALTAFYGTLNFENNAATTSDWILALGNHATASSPTNKFDNAAQIVPGDTELFACLKFTISTTDATKMIVSYAAGAGYVSLGALIDRGADNNFELLCNNTAGAQTYTKSGVTYTVGSGRYQVWMNGGRLSLSAGVYDFTNSQLAQGTNVNTMMLQSTNGKTNGVASNDGSAIISKLSMQFMSFALPVSLVNFSAKADLGKINLNWQTASESNNSHFDVLRFSADHVNPVKIAEVAGKGNSSSLVNYRVTDNAPLNGLNYYQLSQVDYDGTATPSKVISATSNFNNDDFVVYQDNEHYVTANVNSVNNSVATFKLLNTEGKVINEFTKSLTAGNNSIRLCNYILPKGVYVAISNVDGKQTAKKIAIN